MKSEDPLLKHFEILRDKDGDAVTVKDAVAVETRLSVSLDGEEVAMLSCSPGGEKYLAVGFLLSEGLLEKPEEVRSVRKQKGGVSVGTKKGRLKGKRPLTRILTSGCGGGVTFRKEEDIDPAKDLLIDYTTVFSKQRRLHDRLLEATYPGTHARVLSQLGDVSPHRRDARGSPLGRLEGPLRVRRHRPAQRGR
jgi:formate dehydrogenase accessory protein FdhD